MSSGVEITWEDGHVSVFGLDFLASRSFKLEKRVEFCRVHLKIQEKVPPGLSKYRAYLSSQIAEPLYWLTKKKYIRQLCSEEELIEDMEEVAEHLLMVIKIWGPYRPGSEEKC